MGNNKQIQIRCKGSRYMPYPQIKAFQGTLKQMSKESFRKLRSSILKHGWIAPVFVWNGNEILDGHGRLLVLGELLKEGYSIDDLPVVDIEAEDKREAARILLSLNSHYQTITEDGLYEFMNSFDIKIDELQDYELLDINIGLFGDEYFTVGGLVDDDAVPQVPDKPITKTGDLYRLGVHRLLCGDAEKKEDVERLMGGKKADMVFTDPPYNVNYEGQAGKIINDNMSDNDYYVFLVNVFNNYYEILNNGGSIYVAHADTEGLNCRQSFKDARFHLASCLIWRKNSLVIGRSDYQWQHEPILYGWKPTGRHKFYGGRKKTSIQELERIGLVTQIGANEFQIMIGDTAIVLSGSDIYAEEVLLSVVCEEKPNKSNLHPTMKPVGLITRFLNNSSNKNELVADLFLGSGSTLIACEKTSRICYGMEIDPHYCDVIIKRWEDYTGRKVELISR